jgi:hypothetical protein
MGNEWEDPFIEDTFPYSNCILDLKIPRFIHPELGRICLKKCEPAPHSKSKTSLFCDQVCEYNFMRYLELLCCRFELSADKNLANHQEAANSK